MSPVRCGLTPLAAVVTREQLWRGLVPGAEEPQPTSQRVTSPLRPTISTDASRPSVHSAERGSALTVALAPSISNESA